MLEATPGRESRHPLLQAQQPIAHAETRQRGAPVRMIVPDGYGNKSVKWLQRIILTNTPQANDTYATWNNDTVSHIKTCNTESGY